MYDDHLNKHLDEKFTFGFGFQFTQANHSLSGPSDRLGTPMLSVSNMPTVAHHSVDFVITNALKRYHPRNNQTPQEPPYHHPRRRVENRPLHFAEQLEPGPQLELLDLENVFLDEDTFIGLISHSFRKSGWLTATWFTRCGPAPSKFG